MITIEPSQPVGLRWVVAEPGTRRDAPDLFHWTAYTPRSDGRMDRVTGSSRSRWGAYSDALDVLVKGGYVATDGTRQEFCG